MKIDIRLMRVRAVWMAATAVGLFSFAGCGQRGPAKSGPVYSAAEPRDDGKEAEFRSARAELSPEDRRLVNAQEYCVVMQHNRLGIMGAPIKVMIKDQPVFLCCKGCRRKALADPDKTLAKVDELKAKVTTGGGRN